MHRFRLRSFAWPVMAATLGFAVHGGWAHDLKVVIPKHSELTPVQRLNREGVEAVRKAQYEKAEGLFMKAYLFDPTDPFTLNNLGYISEMQGQLERALKFYKLATEQSSTAAIDRTNEKQLEGKPMADALSGIEDRPMLVNRMNVQAIELLSEARDYEAETLLQKTLAVDPKNPFTLNNLGVAEESIGDYDAALVDYREAAQASSKEPVVVTLDRSWRGKPISQMATDSAEKLEKRMKRDDNPQSQANLYSMRGVLAINRNDPATARQDFLKAYALDPTSAFTLNNLGYLTEQTGDIETARFYYNKAHQADNGKAPIGVASSKSVEGQPMGELAVDNQQLLDAEIDRNRQQRRGAAPAPGDLELKRRDGQPVDATPPGPQGPAPAPSPDSAAPEGQSHPVTPPENPQSK